MCIHEHPLAERDRGRTVRGLLAHIACCAQEPSVEPVRASTPFLRSYLAPNVPPVRLENSGRLANLVRAGMLYLTVQDAIALALENNLDIEVARYNPILAEWQLERSQAGGALPGVPSSAAQAGNVANGQGVAGSQAAAGVNTGGNGASGTASTNATIAQIGPIAQTLDPVIQDIHRVQPSDRAPDRYGAERPAGADFQHAELVLYVRSEGF